MPIFREEEETQAVTYWQQRERLHRRLLKGDLDPIGYLNERDQVKKFIDLTNNLRVAGNLW